MVSVWVVEAASDLVVDMVPVRNREVSRGAVMPLLAFDRGADGGPPAVYLEPMLVDVLVVRGMEMAVVQVVRVVAVPHGPVPAGRTVIVLVLVVLSTAHGVTPHRPSPPGRRQMASSSP